MSTTTVFPDPDTESTSVDGRAAHDQANQTISTLVAAVGNFASDTETTGPVSLMDAGTTTDRYNTIARGFFLFDTSAIDDGDAISSATFSLYVTSLTNTLSGEASANSAMVLVSSAPASNTAIVAGDYDTQGSTSFGTSDTQDNLSTSAYNDITLNASGLANISKTGISKFATRSGWDFNDTATGLTWSSGATQRILASLAEQTDTTQDPKLVIQHAAVTFIPRAIII